MEHDIIVISDENLTGHKDKVLLGPIAKAMQNPALMARLARSMAAPIRRRIDYQGIARKVFMVEQLPPGAALIYDRPINEEDK